MRLSSPYLWPYLNELLMLLSAAFAVGGWRAIRLGRVAVHRRRMLVAAGLGAAFLVSYLLRSVVQGDTIFGGPALWRPYYRAVLLVHVLLATVAGVLGVVALRRGLARSFSAHRRVAPWAAVLWLAAAATGLAVFLMLYVIFPPGPTHSPWQSLTR